MERRGYIALVGTNVGLVSGCITDIVDNTRSDGVRQVSMGETVTIDDTRVTVENPDVRKAVVAEDAHPYLEAHKGQYVLVDVRTNATGTYPLHSIDIRSATNGTSLSDGKPVTTIEAERYAFPFPTEQSDSAAICWASDGGTVCWNLPDRIRDDLAAPPEYTVDTFEVLDDERLELGLTVTNEGARDGVFKAQVSFEAFSGNRIIEFSVPAGESRSYTGTASGILQQLEDNGGGTLTVTYSAEGEIAVLEKEI